MALSGATALGRVDLPPTYIGLSSPNAAKLSAFVFEFVVNVAGDYTAGTGITFATILSLLQAAITATPPTYPGTMTFTNIAAAILVGVRVTGTNVPRNVIGVQNNSAAGSLQIFTFATTPTIAEYTVTAGDIIRLLVVAT